MMLAKVVGNVVATQKNENFLGKKLMLVQYVDEKLEPYGSEVLAIDAVGAGIGEVVIVIAEGGSARSVTKATSNLAPIDVCIAGIVDSVDVGES